MNYIADFAVYRRCIYKLAAWSCNKIMFFLFNLSLRMLSEPFCRFMRVELSWRISTSQQVHIHVFHQVSIKVCSLVCFSYVISGFRCFKVIFNLQKQLLKSISLFSVFNFLRMFFWLLDTFIQVRQSDPCTPRFV